MTRSSSPISVAINAIGWALAIAIAPVPASAGLLGEWVERAIEHQVVKRVSEHIEQPPALVPVSLPPGGSFAACEQLFPPGAVANVTKVDHQWRPIALCSNHFAVLYSGLSKTPLVVVERLSREQMAQALGEKRTDNFFVDPRIPRGARAELEDYRASGLDRGHLAGAANQPNKASMMQSFALSNMVPQDPLNNQEIWSKIESDVRKFARRSSGSVYVFTGPVFRGVPKTIGRNKVWIPTHLYKLVYDASTARKWAYVLPNTSSARITAPMDYPTFVRELGWDLLAGVTTTVAIQN